MILVCCRRERRYLLIFACRHPDSPRHNRDLVAVVAGGIQYQLGGGFGSFVLCCGQHAGVGVCGQHDAGMSELILDGLQVSTGQMRQRGGAVAEVVQADGGQPGRGHQGSQAVGEEPGVQWVAVAVGEYVAGVLPSAASGVAFLALPAGVLVLAADFGGPSKTW